MKSSKQQLMDTFLEQYPVLLRIAVSRVGNLEDAYDVLQNLAVKLIQLDADVEIKEYKAYLKTSVRHTACDHIRKENRFVPTDPVDLDRVSTDRFDKIISQNQSFATLQKYMLTLSPEMREAWIRWVFDGDTIENIAVDMGISSATLRQRFHRIRKRIPKAELLITIMFSLIN